MYRMKHVHTLVAIVAFLTGLGAATGIVIADAGSIDIPAAVVAWLVTLQSVINVIKSQAEEQLEDAEKQQPNG